MLTSARPGYWRGRCWTKETSGARLEVMEVTRSVWLWPWRPHQVDQCCRVQGSNALVMPAEGNRFTKDKDLPVVGKILSRKQRKRLEQIVEKKKKKESRAELLAALKSVQVNQS